MEPRYEMTELADQDLLEIAAYIARDSLKAADRVIDHLVETFELLAEMPGIGRDRKELAPGLRSFPVGNYVIYYRRLEEGVRVVRVLHGARNISDLFR